MVPIEKLTALYDQLGSYRKVAKELGLDEKSVRQRLNKLRGAKAKTVSPWSHSMPQRLDIEVRDGTVIVFSDCHWWPHEPLTVAHQALLRMVDKLAPDALIGNGDLLDMAGISRHPPLGWQKIPMVIQELDTAKQHLGQLRARLIKSRERKGKAPALTLRTPGNHDDGRFNQRLAMVAHEFADMQGLTLADHLPEWPVYTSIVVNGHTIIKHRWHGGLSASWSNALKSGCHFVTGHLHRLTVSPVDDLSGPNATRRRRWGVDTGFLADAAHPAFEYVEGNPTTWRSGFPVLTFRDGKLLPPELVEVDGERAIFRGDYVV